MFLKEVFANVGTCSMAYFSKTASLVPTRRLSEGSVELVRKISERARDNAGNLISSVLREQLSESGFL